MEEPQYKRAGNIVHDSEIRDVGHTNRPTKIRLRWRFITWAGILIIALFSTIPDPRAFSLIPMYPMGFDRAIGIPGTNAGGPLGYFLHAGLLVAIMVSTKKSMFFIWSLVLIVVCVLNTKGCHAILEGLNIDG
jgi:hypothetical protein